MNIVIAGAGQVGYSLAKALMEENEVTIIDSREAAIEEIDASLDVLSIYGNVEDSFTYRNIQKDIDLFIAVTNSDEVNLLSCLIIDNIVNVKEKIVRLRNDLFFNENIKNKLGISTMIAPAQDVAEHFNYLADFPHINNVKTFDFTKAFLLSVRAYKEFESALIATFINKFDNKIIVAGIERDEKFFIPGESDIFMPNDLIYFLAFPSAINSLKEIFSDISDKQDVKNCIVYGANQVGIEVSRVLANKNLNVKLIDKNLKNCQNANSILKNSVEVIKSSFDMDSAIENSFASINVFIASTMDDEFNIIKCIEAKQKGIKKVIGINNSAKYSTLMRKLGIEVIRGEKMSAYYSILENMNAFKIITQKTFCGEEGTIYLREIKQDSKLLNAKLSINSKIIDKGNFYVQRDKKFILYKNIETLLQDDILIVFAQKKDSKLISNWLKQ
jgi:trk system potassium uptake protein